MKVLKYIFATVCMVLTLSCSGTIDPEDQGGEQSGGEGGNGTETEIPSRYVQQMVAMQFTSVGCTNCPLLASAIKNIQTNMPGVIIPVAFHMDYEISDPMKLDINRKFYDMVDQVKDNTIGLPMFALNFRAGSQHIVNEYAKIQSEIKHQSENYPAVCGVAIETSYDEATRKLQVKACFSSDLAVPFRYHIMLLEDGIEYAQVGDDSGNYIHDNVLRHVSADDVRGAKLDSGNALVAGKEYLVEKTYDISESWNAAHMKVLVAMLKEDEKNVWGSSNANICAAGDSVEYLYLEKDE